MIDNLHTLKGTLYAKDCRKVPNKKKPTEPDYEFYSIKVESKIMLSGVTRTYIPELSLDKGLSYEGYEIGDPIEVDYYLFGKAISPVWYKTECKAVSIKFTDIEGVVKRERPKQDNTFVAPSPSQSEESNDNDDNLPF